jgi:predicted phosphodiesterase
MLKQIQRLCHKGCRIGYISDTHIEARNNKRAYINSLLSGENTFDVLVLAGDIGDPFCKGNYYQKFLEACTYLADNVLLVAGNHEYYSTASLQKFSSFNRFSMSQTVTKIQHICDTINQTNAALAPYRGRVRFLENSIFHYRNQQENTSIRFVGATLWSNIDIEHESFVKRHINDYHLILNFTPSLSRELFKTSQKFINDSLEETKSEDSDCSVIVITHHAPTKRGVWNPVYDSNPILSSAFGSQFKFTTAYRPDYWIFGHTHYDCRHFSEELGCNLLSNQVGYVSEMMEKQEDIKKEKEYS